jgi:hypothetical protein
MAIASCPAQSLQPQLSVASASLMKFPRFKKADELDGFPAAVLGAVQKVRSVIDILPPVGGGALVAGVGIGCGIGWPAQAAYGPPRAFCGPGIGVAVVGVGYGQGVVGRRFGKDKRSAEAKQNLAALEGRVQQFVSSVSTSIQESFGRMRHAVPSRK